MKKASPKGGQGQTPPVGETKPAPPPAPPYKHATKPNAQQYAIVSDLYEGAFTKHGIGGPKSCVQIFESKAAAKEFANKLLATTFPEQQADWEEAEMTPLEWLQEGMTLGETFDVYPVVTPTEP